MQATHLGAEIKDPTKFGGKKSKAAAKKGAGNTQWDILKMSGIPQEEIAQVGHNVLCAGCWWWVGGREESRTYTLRQAWRRSLSDLVGGCLERG